MFSYGKNILLSVVFLFANTAIAANIPDSGQLLRESTPPPSLAPHQDVPTIQKPVEQKQVPSSGVRVKVSGFLFTGNTVFSSSELTEMMAGFVGREMTIEELNAAAATITNAYRAKGYFLASAFLAPQTIKPGTPITISIVEGILEKIKVKTKPEEARVPKRLLQGYANQVPTGKPAHEGSITAMIMKTNELPGVSSKILLESGEKPGGTRGILDVVEDKPFAVSIDTDNHGNYATGYYRIGSTLELYSPLRLGDQFTLRAQTATSGDTQNVRSSYSLPVFSYGTRVSLDYSYVVYQLGRGFEALKGNGDAHNLSLTISHPLVRNRNLILNATVTGEGKILDDRVDSVNNKNQRHLVSWQAGLAGVQMDRLLGGGSTAFSVNLTSGSVTIDDPATLTNDQSAFGLGTNGGYSKLSMDLSRTQTVYGAFSFFTRANGQWADKNLDTAEQLSLGGPNLVRAWQSGDSSGDRGFVYTAELRYLIDKLGKLPGSLQISGFFDYGYVALHSHPLVGSTDNTRNLTGAGFGVSWFDSGNFSARTTVAWKVNGETTPTNNPMVYFQAVKRF